MSSRDINDRNFAPTVQTMHDDMTLETVEFTELYGGSNGRNREDDDDCNLVSAGGECFIYLTSPLWYPLCLAKTFNNRRVKNHKNGKKACDGPLKDLFLYPLSDKWSKDRWNPFHVLKMCLYEIDSDERKYCKMIFCPLWNPLHFAMECKNNRDSKESKFCKLCLDPLWCPSYLATEVSINDEDSDECTFCKFVFCPVWFPFRLANEFLKKERLLGLDSDLDSVNKPRERKFCKLCCCPLYYSGKVLKEYKDSKCKKSSDRNFYSNCVQALRTSRSDSLKRPVRVSPECSEEELEEKRLEEQKNKAMEKAKRAKDEQGEIEKQQQVLKQQNAEKKRKELEIEKQNIEDEKKRNLQEQEAKAKKIQADEEAHKKKVAEAAAKEEREKEDERARIEIENLKPENQLIMLQDTLKRQQNDDKKSFDKEWEAFIKSAPNSMILDTVRKLAEEFVKEQRQNLSSNSLDALVTQAKECRVDAMLTMRRFTEEFKGIFLEGPMKEDARILAKVNEDYNDDFTKVLDVVRASALFNNAVNMDEALRNLPRRMTVLRVKDRLNKPIDGYRDVLINIRCGNHVCELQLHVETVHSIKALAHRVLELNRVILKKPKAKRRKQVQLLQIPNVP